MSPGEVRQPQGCPYPPALPALLPEATHSTAAPRSSALPTRTGLCFGLSSQQDLKIVKVNLPRVRQAAGAGAQAVVVESISESEALVCADQDHCSGRRRKAIASSGRGPRAPRCCCRAALRPWRTGHLLPTHLWGRVFAETVAKAVRHWQRDTALRPKPLRPQRLAVGALRREPLAP